MSIPASECGVAESVDALSCEDPVVAIDAMMATRRLSDATGTAYSVVGPLAGGETGATKIVDAAGTPFVVKWEADSANQLLRVEGVDLSDRLQRVGWPVPGQRIVVADDLMIIVQDFVAGAPVYKITNQLVDDLFWLHPLRLGMRLETDTTSTADYVVTTITEGGRKHCLHEPLRSHDSRTRRIIDRIEEIGVGADLAELHGNDIAHADLHFGNMLADNGRLAAVVDLDFARVGDAGFDLASLAFTSLTLPAERGVRSRLFAAVAELGDHRRLVYNAHMMVKVLDWSIRKKRHEEIEFWVEQAERLLGH